MGAVSCSSKLRVGVLISGRGTDLQSIIDASEAGEINAEVVVVISNDPNAYGLERAKKHNIPAIAISHRGLKREEHERKIAEVLHKYNVELIVLAGYIRVLTAWFINEFRNKIINIHPALLPLFGGMGMWGERVHRAVLESGMKVSGCTVHVVTEVPDGGPIIAQRAVPVEEDDTEETLAARVLREEHKLLPYVVGLFADNRVKIEEKNARILPQTSKGS
jgi:phosphoribosylglycinamide formyltransferase-1